MKHIVMAAAAALSIAAAVSPAQALVVGTADNANGIPFGGNIGGYYFQQIYNASSFGAGLNINSLSFYTTISPGGAPRAGTFVIYLSTSTAAISTFDTSAFAFPDASFTEVFNGSLSALTSGRLDIILSQAYAYNAAAGNLVMTVREFSLSSGTAFFDTDANNNLMNSRFSAYPYEWNTGLVTGFNAIPATAAVPEPASWAMMIGGFALIGGLARRRKVAISFA